MRVLDVVFDNHPIFDSNTISFETEDKKILDTIILAGINGSGKTTLLSSIFKTFKKLEDNKFCLDDNEEGDGAGDEPPEVREGRRHV